MKPDDSGLWQLDPAVDYLNHGSFGACPKAVLECQQELRREIERQPVDFMARRLPARLDAARQRVAAFLGADPEGLAAVRNVTAGISAVLRSVALEPGDELLTTDHEYNACRNALEFVARRSGARVVVARVPFPIGSPSEAVDQILESAGPRTRLAVIDHVTSQTGLVLPVDTIVRGLGERGIDVLVDGAHAPGMVEVEIDRLGAPYYAGNLHKWVCAPRGAAFLWVREDRRAGVAPLSISHGFNTRRPGRSLFHDTFDWTGTDDPTPFLCAPAAIDHLESAFPGGWPAIRRDNRHLALAGRAALCEALGCGVPAPDGMVGSMASVPLPDADRPAAPGCTEDPLQTELLRERAIEVPIIPWPAPPRRVLRISAQRYNRLEQYRRLAGALGERFAGREA